MSHDALLVVSFGGPEQPDEVRPFLEEVVRGRGVPEARLAEAARHYEHFGGVSPINARNRELVSALQQRLARDDPGFRVYWGNRHSPPRLRDAVAAMAEAGVCRALAFVTSAFDSPAGFTRYLDDLERARAEVGGSAPEVVALPPFFDRPLFVGAQAALLREALDGAASPRARVLFTAHSIPVAMARTCPYEEQLRRACAAVAGEVGVSDWELAYQSRSGSPGLPWLEPDLQEALTRALEAGARTVVVCPIGFVTDHMEVCYDLDVEARAQAQELGLGFVRCATVSRHPDFVEMIAGLVAAAG
jgi:protoporphyrin/coproporphyrin ferrochelatase